MKFQCGTCGKYYLIENVEAVSSRQMLRCTGCGNAFVLHKNLTFSSSSRNSKMICARCGSLTDEAGRHLCGLQSNPQSIAGGAYA